jgi:ABC-type antimicrobial peptide transport system permease subunit
LIRTKPGQTKQALAGIENVCKGINPQFPFTYQFSDEEYQKLYKSEQVVDKLANCFAMLAIFISCLGLLGLAIFATLQRTKEIGIRKVLGASITSLFTMISKEFMLLVLIAFFVAAPLAWFALDNWLQQFAYRTEISAWIFLLAGFAAMFIALATVSYQAIKAALTNPVKSLKTE